MSTIPIIDLTGSAYERGFNYGSLAKEQILLCRDNYRKLFWDRRRIDWPQALSIGCSFESAVDQCDPDYLLEMRGIAAGANVPYEEILTLNARSEILFTDVKENIQECTAFSLLPSVTKAHETWAVQSWDFAAIQRDAVVALRIKQTGKPNIMMFAEAGLIGGKGMNSCGIALTLNALNTPGTCSGLPLHVRMRYALDSETLAMAYQNTAQYPSACSVALTLTHKDGLALCAELTPQGVDVLLPENGTLVHTNHIRSHRLLIEDFNRTKGSTFVRLASIEKQLMGRNKIDLEDIMRILRNHDGYPNSICVHANKQLPIIKQLATNHAVIMNPAQGVAYYAHGNPCETEFETITW